MGASSANDAASPVVVEKPEKPKARDTNTESPFGFGLDIGSGRIEPSFKIAPGIGIGMDGHLTFPI